jgi:hypothetical protein
MLLVRSIAEHLMAILLSDSIDMQFRALRGFRFPMYRGLDIEMTAATLHALTSFELYDQLAAASAAGIDPAECIRALVAAVLQGWKTVCAPEAPSGR